jgi:hypothetical protein
MIKRLFLSLLYMTSAIGMIAQSDIYTHRQYLSGHGCDDMVKWDFFCTDGNNSGKWTKIGVPSCWELQGFGTYQYGSKFYGKVHPTGIASEIGKYKYEFTLPESWNGREIWLVFEASMTDTKVTINGRKAGDVHQGGFYRFQYNVSDRVFFGKKKNQLEVEVSKESENEQVNMAERRADYWNFGGIIRPVFIISKPVLNINRVAINATMDGHFAANCYLNHTIEGAKIKTTIIDKNGQAITESTTDARNSDIAKIDINVNSPRLWSAETPDLYTAIFALQDHDGKTIHLEKEKFGFRTIEVRQHDGVYINGVKVLMRGVNRHSFRPESGRTLSKAKNIEDVDMIKSMNMNAVRLSHYPADPEFLEACDSLGLYVLDELSGWHWAHETVNGSKLVKEMITRDVNHPSIIFWDNGNEGGFNDELEPEFARWDIQKRAVLYPWANRNGMETKHYRSYGETEEYLREPEIFMPTEFLHGLYDGGHGAGLYDYWELMRTAPRCAGGFLWDYADEGVVRTDMKNIIDCVGNYAADGIVGPHLEKEGSYYTIKQVWCPVQVFIPERFHGILNIENRYDFLSLKDCKFDYSYVKYNGTNSENINKGSINGIAIAAHQKGTISIPTVPKDADALSIKVTDPYGKELFTWVFKLKDALIEHHKSSKESRPIFNHNTVKAGNLSFTFSDIDGTLQQVTTLKNTIHLSNGPRFIAYRRGDRSFDQFYNHDDKEAEKKKTIYTAYTDQGKFAGFTQKEGKNDTLIVTANYDYGSLQKAEWHIAPDGGTKLVYTYLFNGVVDMMGVMFDYPESSVLSKQWLGNGPYRVWQNRLQGPQLGIWNNDYNDPVPGESFTYPEFKGYFAGVQWMDISTKEGVISIHPATDRDYIGVYQPRDGRDQLLYTLPETGISLLQVIPPVRNKVNTTDLNGPSAQPFWAKGIHTGEVTLHFK